jgi:hypothetical protein
MLPVRVKHGKEVKAMARITSNGIDFDGRRKIADQAGAAAAGLFKAQLDATDLLALIGVERYSNEDEQQDIQPRS